MTKARRSAGHLESDATLRSEIEWFDALVAGDAGRIDRLATDDHLSVRGDGALLDRAALLAAVRSGASAIESIEIDSRLIRRHRGGFIVASGAGRWQGLVEGSRTDGAIRYTIVWIARGTDLKVAWWQATPLPVRAGHFPL